MLYLAYNAPHTPLQATEKYLSRFEEIEDEKRKTYAAMVSAVDDGVGRVLQTVYKSGIDESTLIVFLSDNGGARNNASSNAPLRGAKSDLFEGGVRVPFAMRWKGMIPQGQVYEHPISSLDIMATIVAENEIDISEDRPLDGTNLMPFLTGVEEGKPHDYLFWRKSEQNAMAIRKNNFKLVANRNHDETPPDLYNLKQDELNAIENQSMYDTLYAEWRRWNDQMKDRVFPSLGEDKWWIK
jgi:arylsulfatase A-like enzyme